MLAIVVLGWVMIPICLLPSVGRVSYGLAWQGLWFPQEWAVCMDHAEILPLLGSRSWVGMAGLALIDWPRYLTNTNGSSGEEMVVERYLSHSYQPSSQNWLLLAVSLNMIVLVISPSNLKISWAVFQSPHGELVGRSFQLAPILSSLISCSGVLLSSASSQHL